MVFLEVRTMANFAINPTTKALHKPSGRTMPWHALRALSHKFPKPIFPFRAPALALLIAAAPSAQAAYPTILWCGHQWSVVTSGMAGGNQGSANTVFVDANGYLHMKITQVQGQWLCAELFTTDLMAFGTYQWWVNARLDQLDPNVVFGLYPYGPEAAVGTGGTNEIDVEFAKWGNVGYANADWVVYPAVPWGTKSALLYNFTLTGSFTTSRFTWSSSGVTFWLMGGRQPLGTTANVMKTWTANPGDPLNNVPQQALPVGMNLWLYGGAAPTNGLPVEIIIYSFAKS